MNELVLLCKSIKCHYRLNFIKMVQSQNLHVDRFVPQDLTMNAPKPYFSHSNIKDNLIQPQEICDVTAKKVFSVERAHVTELLLSPTRRGLTEVTGSGPRPPPPATTTCEKLDENEWPELTPTKKVLVVNRSQKVQMQPAPLPDATWSHRLLRSSSVTYNSAPVNSRPPPTPPAMMAPKMHTQHIIMMQPSPKE